MNTLLIHKKGDNVFWHTHNNLSNTSFAISDFDISIDGNKFKIIERNGAIRYEYNVTNIQVKNLNNPNESFVSGEQLYNRLLQLNYTPFLGNSGSQTLQEVLDNNHDLVDGNNFQGTGAGLDNMGVGVTAIGIDAGNNNQGDYVNALGEGAFYGNTGSYSNALGNGAGFNNTFSFVNLFGLS